MSVAIALLLEAIDDSWSHPWDSFSSSLTRISLSEASWQPPAYGGEQSDLAIPTGCILWHLVHVADCKEHYADAVERRPAMPPDRPNRLAIAGFDEELRRANAIHERFRATIAGLDERELAQTVRGEMPLSRFAQMALRHELWHAGQIRLVRRLFARREGKGMEAGAR